MRDYVAIRYTTTDGKRIEFPPEDPIFADEYSSIISNTYTNGEGLLLHSWGGFVVGDERPSEMLSYEFLDLFAGCDTLESLVIPEGVEFIHRNFCYGCGSLRRVVLPEGLLAIGDSAFAGCHSLEEVHLPESLEAIGKDAFCGCAIRSVYMPKGVFCSCSNVFTSCANLERFDGELASDDGRCLMRDDRLIAFAPAGLTEYTIPEGVLVVEDYAFAHCNKLQHITFPKSLVMIDSKAFYMCEALRSVVLPDGVVFISCYYTFGGCTSLESVSLPQGLNVSYGDIFFGCRSLRKISGPQASADGSYVAEGGTFMFLAGAGLVDYTIPAECTALDSNAITSLVELQTLNLSCVSEFAQGCIHHCPSLNRFVSPYASSDGRCLIYNNELIAFAPAGLKEYAVPEGVERICHEAFYGCAELECVVLPASIEAVDESVFEECVALRRIEHAGSSSPIVLEYSEELCRPMSVCSDFWQETHRF